MFVGGKGTKNVLIFAQSERKSASFAQFATQIDGFAVSFEYMLDNRKSQTGATLLARTPLVGAVEALEDARNVILGDSP